MSIDQSLLGLPLMVRISTYNLNLTLWSFTCSSIWKGGAISQKFFTINKQDERITRDTNTTLAFTHFGNINNTTPQVASHSLAKNFDETRDGFSTKDEGTIYPQMTSMANFESLTRKRNYDEFVSQNSTVAASIQLNEDKAYIDRVFNMKHIWKNPASFTDSFRESFMKQKSSMDDTLSMFLTSNPTAERKTERSLVQDVLIMLLGEIS